MSRSDEFMREAARAADRLDFHCEPILANAVRDLIHAHKTARGALSAQIRRGLVQTPEPRQGPLPPAAPKPITPLQKAATSRLLEPVAAGRGEHTWCDQCDRRVSPAEGRACSSPFCGVKPAELAA